MTTFLGNLFQWPDTFWVKNLFWRSSLNLPWLTFMIFPQVLLLVTRGQRLVLNYYWIEQEEIMLDQSGWLSIMSWQRGLIREEQWAFSVLTSAKILTMSPITSSQGQEMWVEWTDSEMDQELDEWQMSESHDQQSKIQQEACSQWWSLGIISGSVFLSSSGAWM